MTRTEIKAVFHSGEAVIFDGIEYACISAIIYRHIRHFRPYQKYEEPKMQCELLSVSGNSITIAPAERVERKEEEDESSI